MRSQTLGTAGRSGKSVAAVMLMCCLLAALSMPAIAVTYSQAFDSGTDSWASQNSTGANGYSTFANATGGQSGNCLQITDGGYGWGAARLITGVVAGEAYTYTVWVKFPATFVYLTTDPRTFVRQLDASGNVVGTPQRSAQLTVADTWTQVTLTGTIAANVTQVRIGFGDIRGANQAICFLDTVSFSSVSPTPSAPGAANPDNETTSQIRWNWVDNSGNEDGFKIYDAASGGNLKQTLGAGVQSWTESSGLSANTRYSRWVTAYKGANESARVALPSAMTSYAATWHNWDNSSQSTASADTYIASGTPDGNWRYANDVTCGYSSSASLLIRRGMVQFDQSSLPAVGLRRAGTGRASLRMYCTAAYSSSSYTVTGYRVTADWGETGTIPTWNTFNASKEGAAWAATAVAAANNYYTWQWDPYAKGMPVNNRGLMFLAQDESAATWVKGFASKDYTGSYPPEMRMDYYLPANPGWITSLLVLGGVGDGSINTESYATAAGLTGDTDLYGNSTKTYGGKTWAAYNGNVSEDGFSNYAWDLGSGGLNFGDNVSALFNLYVNSSAAASGCYLRCGSDDGIRLIVNDAVVGTDDPSAGRGWAREQSVFGPFSLNAGWNRVLIKVRNGTGGFGLKGVRFSNADATVWSGSTLTFAVDDTTAPSTPTALAVSGVTSDVWQNTVSSPTFTWTSGTDTQGTGEGVSGVRGQKYYLGTSSSGTPDTFQTGTSRAPGAQVDGTYYFKVDTIDYALNESSVETFIFKYDGTKPTNPSATCSDGLASGVWRTTSAPTFTLSGASDATSGLKATGSNARYKYYFGTSASGTPDTGTDSTAISPTLSGDGTYYLRVQTQDDAGNWSDPETVFVYTYAVPPSITSQPSNQIACEGSTATFSVTGSGPDLAYSWMRKGSGWGSAWSVTGSGGSFRASSTDNNSGDSACTSFGASDINSPSGNAFGMWGGASGDTAATRTFSALSANQTASIDFDNGNADSGRKVGFSLQTASGTDLLQFYFLGGQGNYKYNDGTEKDTGISFRRTGLRVQFVLGTANTYTLIVTPCGGTAAYFSGSYASGSIEKLALFNQNTTGGNEYNAYFNNFAIGEYLDNADNYSGDYGGLDYGDQPVASGNGSSTYTTPALSASDNGSQYAVAVWNPYGQVISTTATLTVNPTPSGVGTNLTRFPGGGSVKVRIADLQVTNSVASLSDPAHGTAMKDSTFIYYLPDANDDSADSFTYTTEALSSGCARTATINIQVVDSVGAATGITNASGTISLSFAAIPGYRYDVQRATDVNFTQNVTVLVSTNAPADGLFMVEDPNPPTPEAYYRLKYPGTP